MCIHDTQLLIWSTGRKNPSFGTLEHEHRTLITGVRLKESILFFANDVAPRWASNHGPLAGNYRDKYYLTPGDRPLHAIYTQIRDQRENF